MTGYNGQPAERMISGGQAPDACANMPATAGAKAGFWTPMRLEILAWLRRNAPSLAELYEGAVQMVYETSFPGRVRFVSHAVREIGNRLPEVISGVKENRLEYVNLLDELAKRWPGAAATDLSGHLPPGPPKVPISRDLYLELDRLIRGHQAARLRPEEKAARLFQSIAGGGQSVRETLRPTIRQWVEIIGWFTERVHDSGRIDEEHARGLERQFQAFEMTLAALIRQFFDTVVELDEILEEANS